MTTKEQERKALAQIKKVVEGPGHPGEVSQGGETMTGIYYHDAGRGKYHAVLHYGPNRWRAVLDLDPDTGIPATYSGKLRSKAAAVEIIEHLAPAAVLLPVLPAWMR